MYDLIVIGSGAAGMMSAIVAARSGKNVLLLEKLPKLGMKLKATGGGRCNLTNRLHVDEFISHFGKNGRFMTKALEVFSQQDLIDFFKGIGVETRCADGFRVFPATYDSLTILDALESEMDKVGVEVCISSEVKEIHIDDKQIVGVSTNDKKFDSKNIIIATGGLGYSMFGTTGDGFEMAKSAGHKVTDLYPAMLPLKVKEGWVGSCRADTLANVTMKIDLKKAKKLSAKGDLIFTKDGIRGPVVLDFAREITPFLEKQDEVPLLINITKGMNEEDIRGHFKRNSELSILEILKKIIPEPISLELCKLSDIDFTLTQKKIAGQNRDKLIKLLAWTPLTVIGHDGFDKAMITRGGVSLKEIDPNSLESRLIDGLYFCGEIIDLDGPCGGYNLQWSFSSGYLAGQLL
jgi:predicted Rossmann fold flavoprotein